MVTQYLEDKVSFRSSSLQLHSHFDSRYLLNIKGLPYRTQWVELPDIADLLQSLGVSPNPASPFPYSLPAIYDPRTKRTIMDSASIAKYLDDEHPGGPAVLPRELRAYQVSSYFYVPFLC